MFAKMIDMARSPAEVKEEVAKSAPMPMGAGKPSAPTYPYGLCISLDDESIKKLGLEGEMPDVGTLVHFCAMAKVTSVSEHEQEGTDGAKTSCRRVELQITTLGLESEDAENRAAKWYGTKEEEAA